MTDRFAEPDPLDPDRFWAEQEQEDGPDEWLERQRMLIAVHAEKGTLSPSELDELAAVTDRLDEWLSGGGVYPLDWIYAPRAHRGRRVDTVTVAPPPGTDPPL